MSVETGAAESLLRSISSRVPTIAEAAVMEGATKAAEIYRAEAPRILKDSIRVEGSGMHAEVVADEGKLGMFRMGTKPHEEVVRSGGRSHPYALGTTVGPFYRVHHPGTKPLDWESRAFGSAMEATGDLAAGLDP